ncbi:exodeoxyribonuclease VII large subunit [Flavobacterium olei]|uniref:exodeoxyribonuclease VII large subunit n=1 Tax=Flavobacterium olei TaxID=1886782 RepID=UPI003D2CF24C
MAANLKLFTAGYLKTGKLNLEHMQKSIRMMSPRNILKKGYAVVRVQAKITSSTEQIKEGDHIEVILYDTLLKTTVTSKETYDGRDTDL